MSEKISFTFSVSEVRMEFSCSEEFVSQQMERFEHVFLALAEAFKGRVQRKEPDKQTDAPVSRD